MDEKENELVVPRYVIGAENEVIAANVEMNSLTPSIQSAFDDSSLEKGNEVSTFAPEDDEKSTGLGGMEAATLVSHSKDPTVTLSVQQENKNNDGDDDEQQEFSFGEGSKVITKIKYGKL